MGVSTQSTWDRSSSSLEPRIVFNFQIGLFLKFLFGVSSNMVQLALKALILIFFLGQDFVMGITGQFRHLDLRDVSDDGQLRDLSAENEERPLNWWEDPEYVAAVDCKNFRCLLFHPTDPTTKKLL